MLGSDKAFAHPTLVISHNDEVILKRTMRVVRRPKTLKWKGFKLKGRQVLQYPAPSMTCAVRGVVELCRAVKREKELHQEILAFSISHEHRSVRIYGHYAIIEEE